MELNEENIEIRKKLLNLPKLKASENFQINLQNKIKLLALEEEQAISARKQTSETGIFQKLFGVKRRPWLVPAFGLTVVAVLAFSVIFIFNKDNSVSKLPDVTVTKESAPTQQEKNNNTGNETLKKEELSGKQITEDYASNNNTPGITEQKYTDQGSKPKLKTESEKPSVKSDDGKGLVQPPPTVSESISVDSKGEVKKSNIGNEQPRPEKKVADSENKNNDEKVARSEVSKKDDIKESIKENNLDTKSLKGATDIDKKSLQSLKDKIEKTSGK